MREQTVLENIRWGGKAFHAVNMALNARAFNIQGGVAIEFQNAAVITMDGRGGVIAKIGIMWGRYNITVAVHNVTMET